MSKDSTHQAEICEGFSLIIDDENASASVSFRLANGSETVFQLKPTEKAYQLYDLLNGKEIKANETNTEIERSFTVKSDAWRNKQAVKCHSITQGYFAADANKAVRMRIQDDTATFCVKMKPHYEFEFPLPPERAKSILRESAAPTIEKTRHVFPVDGTELKWEIDEYKGALQGLVKAEIEVPAKNTPIPSPHWLGNEVSDRKEYKDGYMAFYGKPESPARRIG